MRKKPTPIQLWLIFLLCIWVLLPATSIAGNLDPTASPAPTMKSLDEIEPRISIPGSDSPLGTYTISESGSYYLTGDRLCNATGIQVEADNVTLDLMGYSLIGPGTGTHIGINMSARSNVEIRNGTISSFNQGIYADDSCNNSRVLNIRAIANILNGIRLRGASNLIKDCTSMNNGNSAATTYGIYGGVSSVITDNIVCENGNSAGNVYALYAGSGSTVSNNSVSANGSSSTSYVYGIYCSHGTTVTNNSSRYNGDRAENVRGILALEGATVKNNSSFRNGYYAKGKVYGIRASEGSTLSGNTSRFNGHFAGADGEVYGIHAANGCTVTNNTSGYNGDGASTSVVYGLYLKGHSFVDQNTAYNNNGTNMNTCATCTVGSNHAP